MFKNINKLVILVTCVIICYILYNVFILENFTDPVTGAPLVTTVQPSATATPGAMATPDAMIPPVVTATTGATATPGAMVPPVVTATPGAMVPPVTTAQPVIAPINILDANNEMLEKQNIFYELQKNFVINNSNLNIDTHALFYVQDPIKKKTAQDSFIASNPTLKSDIDAINNAYDIYNISLKKYYSALNIR